MSDNFGFKIGVEGERDFKNALQDIRQTFKILGSEMNLVASQFEKQDKSVEAVTARSAVLNKEIDAQKDKISTLEKALQNASASFGENDRRTQNWAVQLNNAKADLNGMEKELQKSNSALDSAGKEFDSAEKQANQFGDEVSKAASKTDNAGGRFEKLGGVLKGVGSAMVTCVAAVGTATVGAAVGAYKLAESASNLNEAQNVVQQTFKTSSKSVLEWSNGISNSAGIGKTAATSMVGSMGAMLKSSGMSETAASSMSEKMVQLSGDMASFYNLDNDTAWEKIRSGISGEAEPLKQLGINMSEANLSAFAMSQGITTNYKSMTQAEQTQLRYNYLLSVTKDAQGDFTRTSGGMANQQRILQMNLQNLSQSIGSMFLPMVNDGIKSVNGIATALNDAVTSGNGFDKLGDIVGKALTDLLKKVSAILPGVTTAAVSILSQLISSLTTAIPTILPALTDGVVQLITAFTQILQTSGPLLINAGMLAITTLINGIIQALPQITNSALQLLLTLVNGIIANLPQLVQAALQMVVTLASGIGDALPKLIPAMIDAILTIVNTLLNNMDKVLSAAFKIIEGLAKGLINALPKLIDRLPQIINTIVNFIVNNLPLIIETGVKIIVELAAGLIKAIPTLVAKLPQIISSLVGGFGKLLGAFNNIGNNIVSGIWQGISGMRDWIYNKVSGFFGGIVDSVKGLLGIHSPSTVFAGIGGYMAQGLGQGFSKAMNDVSADMQNSIPTNFNLNPALSLNNSTGGMGGSFPANSGFTLHIENFVNNTEKDIQRLAYEFEFYRQQAAAARGNA